MQHVYSHTLALKAKWAVAGRQRPALRFREAWREELREVGPRDYPSQHSAGSSLRSSRHVGGTGDILPWRLGVADQRCGAGATALSPLTQTVP